MKTTFPQPPSSRRLHIVFRFAGCSRFACALSLGLLLGCSNQPRTVLPAAADRIHFPPTEAFYQQQEIQRQRTWDESNVRIEGDDILLPESTASGTQSANYAFYVYAYDPNQPTRTAEQLLAAQELRIDVIGAEAELSFPLTPPQSTPPASAGSMIRSDAYISGNVVKLTVKSQSATGKAPLLKPFTIVAWFPVRHAMARAQDTRSSSARASTQSWYARRDVKTYYGDIRTRVQIVSDTEAQAAFGTEFPRHFYVGRVFLRNRSSSRSLAVYTTSMRVPSLFYRKTELAASLPPETLTAFDTEARRVLNDKAQQELSAKAQRAFDAEAQPTFEASPETHASNAKLESRQKEARAFVFDFLKQYPLSPTPLPAPNMEQPTDLQKSLERRALALWATYASRTRLDSESPASATLAASDTLIRTALAELPPYPLPRPVDQFLADHPELFSRSAKLTRTTAKEILLAALAEYPPSPFAKTVDQFLTARSAQLDGDTTLTRDAAKQLVSAALEEFGSRPPTEAVERFLADHPALYGGDAKLTYAAARKLISTALAVFTPPLFAGAVEQFLADHPDILGGEAKLTPATARKLISTALAGLPPPPLTESVEQFLVTHQTLFGGDTTLTRDTAKKLVSAALAEFGSLPVASAVEQFLSDHPDLFSGDNKLTRDAAKNLVTAALKELVSPPSAETVERLLSRHPELFRKDTELTHDAAKELVSVTWRARQAAAAEAQGAANQATTSREVLFAEIEGKLKTLARETDPSGADKGKAAVTSESALATLLRPWSKLNQADTPGLIDQAQRDVVTAVNGYSAAVSLRDDLATHARRLAELRLTECRESAVAAALQNPGSARPADFAELIRHRFTQLRLSLLGPLLQASPFATLRPVPVNIAGNPLAFSTNPSLQRQMLEEGYMWRDYYRPMTFQAVLNAVMFTHARDTKTRSVEFLESLARLAGGAVGLSGIFNEVGSSNFAQGVNFFSTILVPELRARLVEDLKRHITNLGEMSMDTVVIIPPNESFDRYVFFPRGPIYNFPDEFDATTPAYIAAIEGEELFVEATPIDPGQTLRGGTVDALTLTGRALNEGEKSTQARLLEIAATQSQLRPTELAHLTQRITAIMDSTPADDPAARRRAEAIVRQQVAAFTAYFGTDASGTLSYLLQQHGLSSTDAPPLISPTVAVELLPGSTSVEQTLHVLDDLSTPENLKPEATADKPDDLTVNLVPKTLRYQIVSLNKDNPVDTKPYTVTFKITDAGHNVATASQSVKVQPVRFDITHQGEPLSATEAKPVEVTEGAAYALTITANIYDVDPAKLALTLRPNPKDPQDKRNPVQSQAATVLPGVRQIRLETSFDPSGYLPTSTAPAKANPSDAAAAAKADSKPDPVDVSLKLALDQDKQTIGEQTIHVRVIPKREEPSP